MLALYFGYLRIVTEAYWHPLARHGLGLAVVICPADLVNGDVRKVIRRVHQGGFDLLIINILN